MLTTLRQTFGLIERHHRKRWAMLVVIALFASGVEMVGAVLVYTLISLVADPSGQIDLPVIGDVRRLFSGTGERRLLLWLVVVMAVFFLLRAATQIGSTYVQSRVANNLGARLSNRLVEGYLRMPYSVHLQRNSSELIRNAYQAVQAVVSQVFVPVIRVIADGFLTLGLLAVLVTVAPAATGVAVLVIGGTAAILLWFVQPRLKRLGRIAHRIQRDTLRSLQQSLHGIRDIKILGRERYFSREYGRSRVELARASYRRAAIVQLPSTFVELALVGLILLFFGVSVVLAGESQGTLSVLGLFAYASLRLQPSIQRIIGGLNNLRFSSAPIEDLDADLRAIEALPRPLPVSEPLPFTRSISLRAVSFGYESAHVPALTDIDLTIARGEQVGICGPTGGGKTTLVDLIAGLLEPNRGTVTVDGVDIHANLRAWQANLGVVSQAMSLLDGTIRENIALGVPKGEVDEDALREAVEVAQLGEFVASLPEGFDTRVGERGIRVSGGQRQRIAIARALYRRPEVLIFDEGTSALDNTTETELMEAIERLRGARTILLVAHRLSTVRDCDRVIFIEDGRITGQGRYGELVVSHRSFRVMATAT